MRTALEQEGSDTGAVTPSPRPADTPDKALDFDADGHGPFRDLCLIYGDFRRTVFLQEIINWFVRSASKAELAALRKAVSLRSAEVGKGGKRGRPRGRDDADWLVKVKVAAWHRIVDGWTWRKIAEAEGLKPNHNNIRTMEYTLSRRQDQYAAIIWEACRSIPGVLKPGADSDTNLASLQEGLKTQYLRQWLWLKAGLPFKDLPDGCSKIVLTLASRGEVAAERELFQHLNYRRSKRQS
jgi:hypothetical protein